MSIGGPLARVVVIGLLLASCSAGDETGGANNTTTSSTAPSSSVETTLPTTDPEPTITTTTTTVSVPVPTYIDENGFDDHSVPSARTVDELLALSRTGVGGQTSMKFTIPEFDRAPDSPDLARVHLMDSNFYGLHDEWYYYRLLNGQAVPGASVKPVVGGHFDTIADIYRWAAAKQAADLPLDLVYNGERLYSTNFYDLALDNVPRTFGVGSLVRIADPIPGKLDHWLIELEYTDVVTPAIIHQFFARLATSLPAEVFSVLEWVVRSPQQEAVAAQMMLEQLPFYDRVAYFRDLVPVGTVSVYSDGVAAGRLLYVGDGGAQLGDAKATDIIVTERVPDWLPPASALITSELQTPLAHVNLLARNRGIPNASQAGIHDDAGLRQAARVHAYAIVIARGSTLQIALITSQQYAAWTARQQPPPVSVARVDISNMPLVVNLEDLATQLSTGGLTEADLTTWRPIIGGKSAGYLTLLSTPGLTPPPDPLAITIKPYVEHLAPIRNTIASVIVHADVTSSPRARWLALEGSENYATIFPSVADKAFAEAFVASHPPGSPLGDVLAAGGIRGLIESRPISRVTLAAITAELEHTYGDYDVSAGLRFRSSSSVEDIEGFNGAGLYTSYTGYLRADLLDDLADRDKTIERALLRAWSSYWSFEAFEERRLSQIDHLSGAMGLTVHARFDDDLERNNGVATLTFTPGGAADDAVVEINVQAGFIAVTNPDPVDVELPEVIRVIRRSGLISIERLSGSTVLASGEKVLTDAAVRELFAQTLAVGGVWRDRVNASVPVAQRSQTVVLDFEFKTMKAGWPHLVKGAEPYPARLVVRQVRSLDPGLRAVRVGVRALPIPRDILMRAALVESVSCHNSGQVAVEHLEVRTDPLVAPDMGYSGHPLVIGPTAPAGSVCTRTTLYASADQELVAIVADGKSFVIIG